ncbi:efflux RND transporter periplasmic adaptor subunit [Colwellia sp. RSH04]|uniref:efflux RND transporter periplasmic adaptor subunit n=1 Tax=Colwellia sp. RSH04 TaxID=2305464 RepID=UPI000E56895F|nr:HlyD family efflux transporter periplasmic adaptor subunit [Colwellia sp. RSH04]RHW75754.1 HlyD family efflux transporter periplasmic adaptor subunit [Colwellia sp. RSH04]
MKKLIVVGLALLTIACEEQKPPMLYQVQEQAFAIKIPARGELFAAQATVISSPVSRGGVQNIAWLAPEYSTVKKGDVIARFDGEAMEVESERNQNEAAIIAQDILEKSGSLNKDLYAINKDITVVGQEKAFADQFSIDDVRIRSKLEIIDSLQNTAYLGVKQDYLHWKSDSFNESSMGDMSLLEMKQKQKQSKLAQLSESLEQLEIKAPHDGLLAYKANWRGEKPRAGQSVWPGQKIAELPDINEMKAKLFVIESEAIGLVKDKEVNLHLFAHVDKPFTGRISSVAPFPKSIKRGDPQKYFEVEVSLNEQNTTLFVPGRKLQAQIIVDKAQLKLVVPLQSVFTKDNRTFVFVYDSGKFTQAEVELGKANLSHVEVVSGISAGQHISLIDQEHS